MPFYQLFSGGEGGDFLPLSHVVNDCKQFILPNTFHLLKELLPAPKHNNRYDYLSLYLFTLLMPFYELFSGGESVAFFTFPSL